jgi:heme/copper-type cytochrome/quinol oxidase subunit 2
VSIFTVIVIFGLFVAGTMTLVMVWYRRNRRVHHEEIEALLEIARSEEK